MCAPSRFRLFVVVALWLFSLPALVLGIAPVTCQAQESRAPGNADVPDDAITPADGAPGLAPPEGSELITDRYPNGQPRVERYVIKNEKGDYVNHGPWTWYGYEGEKWAVGEFVMGQRHGPWMRKFFPGQGPMFAGPLYAGHRGPFTSEATFVNGQLEGVWIIKDSRGQTISDWRFVAGQPDGLWTWFYPDGTKQHEASFAGGQPVGVEIEYGPKGKIISQSEFIDGRRQIKSVEWYGPKQKHWEGLILEARAVTKTRFDWYKGYALTEVVKVEGKDEKVGPWTWWFPNGQKRSEGAFVAGQRDGLWTWWHPNGQKWIEGTYVMGKKSGTWTWWDDAGKVEKTQDLPVAPPPAGGDPAAASASNGAAGTLKAANPAAVNGAAVDSAADISEPQ